MAGGIVHSINGPFLDLASGQTGWTADHTVPEGAVAGVVPIGAIVMWSGTIATVPTHWAFCDGTANAPGPDLRNQFVVGAQQDSGGVAKTNIEGSLKVSATQTGATVADHVNLTHDGAVASHPDLTHAALSHPALTVVHADHSLASVGHTHASGADVSVASALGSRPAVAHTHASFANASNPSGTIASQAIASGVDVSVASGTLASQAIASGVDISIASITGASAAGVSSFATSTNRSGLTALASHSHAAATASRPSLAVASGSVASSLGSRPSLAVASGSVAANAAVSVPAISDAGASGVDVSLPAQTASRPSLTGSGAAVTATHGDHSLASLTHGAIGTHANLSHAYTPATAHGTAGTLTHSTVAIVPAYYALAFIQRMS